MEGALETYQGRRWESGVRKEAKARSRAFAFETPDPDPGKKTSNQGSLILGPSMQMQDIGAHVSVYRV